MTEVVMSALLLTGAVFLLLAAVGVVRMPDVYSRLQASAKASTLGVGLVVLALAVYFSDLAITVRALLVIAFLYLTTPVAAHVIGRAAYFIGVPLWEGTRFDELKGQYDPVTHELKCPDEIAPPAAR